MCHFILRIYPPPGSGQSNVRRPDLAPRVIASQPQRTHRRADRYKMAVLHVQTHTAVQDGRPALPNLCAASITRPQPEEPAYKFRIRIRETSLALR